jgi:hypothetical protein
MLETKKDYALQSKFKHQKEKMLGYEDFKNILTHSQAPLVDSNANMKGKQQKNKELGTHSLARNTLGVKGRVGALGWD